MLATTDTEPDFRLRYNRNAPEPNRLIVWDIKNNKIDSYRETRDILKKNIKELIKNHL